MADPFDQYDPIFQAAGQEWNVDWRALKAMAAQESSGNPRAVSKAGAQGLMQIMPDTASHLGMTDAFDPAQSIYGGAKYMNEALTAEKDNPQAALLYYHGGPGWRQSFGSESAGYVPAVASKYQRYAKADASTVTDAAPAPAEGKVAKTDDAFTRALRGSAQDADAPKAAPAAPAKAAEPDAFTKALGTPQETAATTTGLGSESPIEPPKMPVGPVPDPVGEAVVRVAKAGIDAAKQPGPDVFGPATGFWQQLNPGINALAAGARGVGAAGLQAIYEAGEPLGKAINIPTPWGTIGGPGLGGDLATMATVAPAAIASPAAAAPSAIRLAGEATPAENALSRFTPQPTYVSPPEGSNLLSPKAEEYAPPRVSPPPSSAIPEESPPASVPAAASAETRAWVSNTARDIDALVKENAAAGGPSSLSAAATPPADAAMSPQLSKAYRRMSEVNQIVSPIEGPDWSTYVEGSVPTQAEGLGKPAVSQAEKLTRTNNPEPFTGEQGRLTQNNAARLRKFDDLTLSDPQIATIEEDQAKAAQAATARIKAKAGPVDAQDIADHVNGLLSDPRIQERTDVVKVIKPIRDALYDAEGKLKTDPMSYWGIHDDLMAKLAKAKDPLNASSSEKFAFDQINGVKKLVDSALSNATGGEFGKFLEDQSGFFQQLNAAKILRDFRTKMVDKNGNIYADRFHKFVTDLAVRRGKPGVDAAMDIPDETMQGLINIDQDLKRAARIDLGKPYGSPTNLYFELAKGLGIAGAHAAVAGLGGGPILNLGLQTGMGGMQRMIARARLGRLTENALNPPEAPRTNMLNQPSP